MNNNKDYSDSVEGHYLKDTKLIDRIENNPEWLLRKNMILIHKGFFSVKKYTLQNALKITIEKIKAKGKLVFGPYAADGFFGSETYKQFDGVLATYHDQGLAPFKALSFGNGVNYTAGLNKVRTSPDHGTAYEIAGKGVADENSFKEAMFTAIKIFRNRFDYEQLTSNPLKKAPKKM